MAILGDFSVMFRSFWAHSGEQMHRGVQTLGMGPALILYTCTRGRMWKACGQMLRGDPRLYNMAAVAAGVSLPVFATEAGQAAAEAEEEATA